MRRGARDYVEKPRDDTRLLATSAAMRPVLDLMEKVGPSEPAHRRARGRAVGLRS